MTNNPTIDGVSRCKTCRGSGWIDNLRSVGAPSAKCPGCAPAVERQEPEKVDHPNFLEFAICDTCAAESLCCEVAPNEHLCGGCYWAPINERAHADQVTALQSTIARLEARVAELESGRREPVAWRFRVSSGGDWFTTTKERVADLYRGTEDGGEVEPLFTAPPAPVAVVPDERAAFDAWAVKHGRVVGYNGWRNDFEVWQARACLDATAALNKP